MLHGMGRPAESLHVRVSKDTVREENGLGELGKGLLIPAEPLQLKLNMHGPAPRPIHAHAMKFHATLSSWHLHNSKHEEHAIGDVSEDTN